MDNTVMNEEYKKFLVIPEDYLLNWVQSFSQKEIDTKDSALYTVRTLLQIHEDALLVMEDEIVLNEENPEQEKLKQWMTP